MVHILAKSIRASCAAMLVFYAGAASAENVSFISGAGSGPTVYVSSANPLPITGAGLSGSVSNASSGVATSSTNLGAVSWLYGYNGATWDQLQVDGSKYLKINCVTGCASGTVTIAGPLGTGAAAAGVAVALDSTSEGHLANIDTNSGNPLAAGSDSTMIGGVNVKEINGVAPLMGNGATGTGAQRVTLSDDSSTAAISISGSGTTQIVAASGSTVIHIRQITLVPDATNTVTLESGDTGGSCANPVTQSGAMALAANAGFAPGGGQGDVMVLPSGKAFCILTTAAAHGWVTYKQY